MQTTTKKLNRAELLQMAIDGKVKRGEKFKDERGDIAVYGNRTFTWEQTGVELRLTSYGDEHFTPVVEDKEVMVRLKQSEINDLAITLGQSIHSNIRSEAQRDGIELMTTGMEHTRLFRKFRELMK
ncbi:hypothetical protein FT641_27095 [Bacillus paranthracis]|uniref:hypothetical protein n=1 Tax=Bacillus paranthracis TaxID=2026186 RepID=UPI00187ADD18|nr:hypothetical protein [Bacillus paranthracis]MBE7117320.1 hypothetical protein [Bacillus paranthracis]MBE7134934.1 hypothetical protein [Bacillus paranthracis]MBE7156343.1 hypothetical protein [Bacillus paranthracis]